MSTGEEKRLQKLNAYLAAKGRRPKQLGSVNFIKQNIGLVSGEKIQDAGKSQKTATKENGKTEVTSSGVKKTPKRPLAEWNSVKHDVEKLGSFSEKKCKVVPKTPIAHRSNRNSISGRGTFGMVATPKSQSKLSRESYFPRTPASRSDASLRKDLLKHRQASVDTKPKSTAVQTQKALLERLNRWLIAKGKKPKMIGFKPGKTISTPAGSPAPSSTVERTHWKGLRDADNSDELSALIDDAMDNVHDCMEEGCPPSTLRTNLLEMAEHLDTVKQHARYWVTLSRVEQAAGTSHHEICDLLAEAVKANARPVEAIQEAIKDLALQSIGEKSTPLVSAQCGDERTPSHAVIKAGSSVKPVFADAATSPINFPSNPATPAVGTPSSVVKLRLVPRSCQTFEKLRFRRALPDDTRAIVTPVRRSMRIASSQRSYPRNLREREPCLSAIEDVLPALQQNAPGQDVNEACGIVFDPNSALGDDFSDIATVLKF